MTSTLKKIDENRADPLENVSSAPLQDGKKPWQRQEGESVLWFNRFVRYRKLGAKRSLQAAVEQEQEQVKALKSPKKPVAQRRGRHSVTLQAVTSTRVQVPGSWKAASVTWRWVERARAWDAWNIDQIVRKQLEDLQGDTLAFNYTRVRTLDSMVKVLSEIFNRNVSSMSILEINALTAQIQSLLRDIRKEMEGFDEAAARAIMSYNATKLYNNMEEELAKRGKK